MTVYLSATNTSNRRRRVDTMMDIKELKVTIGEVCEGYFNDAEEGVVGYDERLDIRPKYQR